jgi:putative FmdB family regulatory protein
MPIYEYVCRKCKTEFELRLSFSEANSTALCPKCYSEAEKLISGFACKTGSTIQTSPKPFRKRVTEDAKPDKQPAVVAGLKDTKK